VSRSPACCSLTDLKLKQGSLFDKATTLFKGVIDLNEVVERHETFTHTDDKVVLFDLHHHFFEEVAVDALCSRTKRHLDFLLMSLLLMYSASFLSISSFLVGT